MVFYVAQKVIRAFKCSPLNMPIKTTMHYQNGYQEGKKKRQSYSNTLPVGVAIGATSLGDRLTVTTGLTVRVSPDLGIGTPRFIPNKKYGRYVFQMTRSRMFLAGYLLSPDNWRALKHPSAAEWIHRTALHPTPGYR